jgi:hypothetical protein
MKYSIKGKTDPSTVKIKELIPVSPLLRLCIAITEDGGRVPVLMNAHELMAVVDPEVPYIKISVEDGRGLLTKS